MISHYILGPMTTLHNFGSKLGRHVGTSFGFSQFHGHGYWLVCEVALTPTYLKHITSVVSTCLRLRHP